MGMLYKKVIVRDDCNKNNTKLLTNHKYLIKNHSNVLYSIKGIVIRITGRM